MTNDSTSSWSLDDKYLREEGIIYLSGIQALVRVTLDQHRADARRGLRTATLVCGYRGSPLGGLDSAFERAADIATRHEVRFVNGVNEELAATAVFGSQLASAFPAPKYDGVLGMWYGKGPGVDRAGDIFKHANFAGIGKNGGVLALAGDDPSCKSSTIPSQSEPAFWAAGFPVLYPGSVQEVLDLGLHGYALSRYSGLWVGMKCATDVCDEAGTAEVSNGRVAPVTPPLESKPFSFDPRLFAPFSLEMEATLHTSRLEAARAYAAANNLNRIVERGEGDRIGIVASGKTWFDLRQALRRSRPCRRGAAARRSAAAQDRHAPSARARHRARVRQGPRGDRRRRGEAALSRAAAARRPLRRAARPAHRGQARRGRPCSLPGARRARRGLDCAAGRAAAHRSLARSAAGAHRAASMPFATGPRRSPSRAARTSAAGVRTTDPPSCPRARSPAAASAATPWPSAWTARRRGSRRWAAKACSGWARRPSPALRTSSRTSATARSSIRDARHQRRRSPPA